MADLKSKDNITKEPTLDTYGGVEFAGDPKIVGAKDDTTEIINTLQDYFAEADNNRKSGLNPRDDMWRRNLDLYWNRYDFTSKQSWQSQETMPEVPNFVDRFAAALKEALIQTPDSFYTVTDPADTENDMGSAIKRVVDVWLSTAGRNQTGQLLPYSAVFEEQMKMGAIMASAAVVTWKNDVDGGRVAVESIDPRMVWLDHTYRNLYRIRRVELDRHELAGMKSMTDGKGVSIFNEEEISKLESSLLEKNIADTERTGTGQSISSSRRPIELDEYIATVVGRDGSIIADRALMVLANRNYLIRGPEKNPFWHGKDWLTYTPLVTAPLSVYGRSYMEDFGSVAKTFNDLTNMILDAVHTSSLSAFAMVPSMLLNPNQVAEGISPNKIFMLEDGYKASDFAQELALGTLSPDAVKIWQSMKQELTEAAGINEIGLGQFAPKGRTSATEITETQQSSSALIRSVAQTVETRFLDPQLDLIWKTGMQHADPQNDMLKNAAGEEMWGAMIGARKELVRRPVTFQARGISSLIARSQQLKTLMSILSVVGQDQILMQAFLAEIDIKKLVDRILFLAGVDITKLQLTVREKMVKDLAQPIQQAGQNVPPGTPPAPPQTQQKIGGAVKALGIGR